MVLKDVASKAIKSTRPPAPEGMTLGLSSRLKARHLRLT